MTKISAPGSGECEWPVKESDGTAASHRDTAPDGSGGAMLGVPGIDGLSSGVPPVPGGGRADQAIADRKATSGGVGRGGTGRS